MSLIFLYYKIIYPCTKPDLNKISTEKSAPAKDMFHKNQHSCGLSCYLQCQKHDHLHRFWLYLPCPPQILQLRCSHTSAWFFFINGPVKVPNPMNNTPFHIVCSTINNAMSSVAEANTSGIYMANQHTWPMGIASINLGHPQPTNVIPFYTNNYTAREIFAASLRQKLSKSFDVCFYRMSDQIRQGF